MLSELEKSTRLMPLCKYEMVVCEVVTLTDVPESQQNRQRAVGRFAMAASLSHM